MPNNELEIFEIFPWNSNFETGLEDIDLQHKQLVSILNRLAAYLADLSDDIVLNDIFDELAEYATYHFTYEEDIWKKYLAGDEWLSNHEHSHGDFIGDVLKLRESDKSVEEVIYDIVSYLSQWLAFHILDADKRMSQAVIALQNGETLESAKDIANAHMQGSMKLLVNTVLTMYDSLSMRTLDLMREKNLRKQVEKELQLSQERWSFVLDGAGENIWDWDIHGNELYCDDSLHVSEIVHATEKKHSKIHKDDIKRVTQDFQDHLDGKTDFYVNKHRVLQGDGGWVWVLSRAKVVERDENGVAIRMVGTHSDITERELASLIYNNSSQAMCITNVSNNIISVNPAFTEITGFTKKDAIGKNPKFMSSGKHDKQFYCDMWDTIHKKGYWSGEIWNRRKKGQLYPEVLNINTIYNKDAEVDHYVALFTDITDKKKAEDLILEQANYDSLTKLQNRRMFSQQLEHEIDRSKRTKIPFVLMFIDLDHFKEVNDSLGHDIGDLLLVEAAHRIKQNIRSADIVSRLGGDEFTVICPELEDHTSIDRIASNLIESLSQPYNLSEEMVYLSASIGITLYPHDAHNSSDLLKHADKAMYLAKQSGRGCFSYFMTSMDEEAKQRRSILRDLHIATNMHEFELYYQPIIDVQSGALLKAEALIRWNHPRDGVIYPDAFIGLSEESGLIMELGDWVYKEAMRQAKIWKDKYNLDIQISVNKSPIQFNSLEMVDEWIAYLDDIGLDGSHSVIEITENLMMEDSNQILEKLTKLRDKGVEISLDDFGTGYSSLSYLKKFDVHYIKIDQCFVKNLEEDSLDKTLCEAMIVMAHKLGIKVVAEGVETQLQYDLLKSMDCDYVQGFLFSPAVPVSEFEILLEINKRA
jgi:diguanylate cyclase (GGDEF)-like protein/hemerythrin-like metal-binding protein/PAS domain S-box-containing protein